MSKFNATSYYRLTNDAFGSERSMSCGNVSVPRDVTVNTFGRFSSENWQFHYQDGVYFIRNFLYNTTYHLGVNKYMLSAPIMLRATTELGQQWNIDSWGDGTYRLSNRLINSGATNITYAGVGEAWNSVLMLRTETGSKWTIASNPDRGRVPDAMLSTYSSIETPVGRPAPTSTSTAPATTSDGSFFDPQHLGGLDKAGIGIGAITMVLVAVILYFFWRRYRKHGHAKGTPGPRPMPGQPRHGSAEVIAEPPPAYNARHNDPLANHGSSTRGDAPDYYAAHRGSRRKAADEESIELPSYGRPTTDPRSFV